MILKEINRYCLAAILLLGMYASTAQEKSAIRFERNLSMQQILAKARKENKFVFIDVMATWCAPCKKMDKEVFSNEEVGALLKDKFIAVKVQADSTMGDDAATIKFRKDAKEIDIRYHVTSYPTYIFLNPDGRVVEKTGIKRVGTVQLFKTRVDNLLHDSNVYVSFLQRYGKGERPYEGYAKAIEEAKWLEDHDFAKKLGREYIEKYLNKLKLPADFKKEDFDVMIDYLQFSDDKLAKMMQQKGAALDSATKAPGLAQVVLESMIMKEGIYARIYKDAENKQPVEGKPDWNNYTTTIGKKFGAAIAKRLVLIAKVNFYQKKKEWDEYALAAAEYFGAYGDFGSTMGRAGVNNSMFNYVFSNVADQQILLKAAAVQHRLVTTARSEPTKRPAVALANEIDTYANLLYRGGKVEDAIEWQQKAAAMDTTNKSITDNLAKMKLGKPTWTK